jgi:putative Mg2+ transporter-C (MgtC) family protein
MRLQPGILSGMGFISGGDAIVRRDNFVVASLPPPDSGFSPLSGLCFGGGQIAVGLVGAALALLVSTGLKFIETRIKQDRQCTLFVVSGADGPNGGLRRPGTDLEPALAGAAR